MKLSDNHILQADLDALMSDDSISWDKSKG